MFNFTIYFIETAVVGAILSYWNKLRALTKPFVVLRQVYAAVGRPLLEDTLDGYNCCLLAYGQSGSGKTHTMLGRPVGQGAFHTALTERLYSVHLYLYRLELPAVHSSAKSKDVQVLCHDVQVS